MLKWLALLVALPVLTGCASSSPEPDSVAGTPDDGWSLGGMVSTANPHATDAAIEMLARGGHAVDAAIAAHLVLGLVEPQSSGIGGGGFMLVFDHDSSELTFHDGREEAPGGADLRMFMKGDKPMGFREAWQSGNAVGVPGAVAMYKLAHDQHGRLPWKDLFEPAIRLADEGFVVSPRLAGYLPRMAGITRLDENPGAAEYFYPGGKPLAAGDVRDNPAYAVTLRSIADEGPSAFYTGPVAESMVDAATAPPNAGTLSIADLAGYRAVTRPAVCGGFRALSICTTTPPSSGGAQIMIATLYGELVTDATSEADRVAAFVDAQRLAYADRDHYFGDPDEVEIPLDDLLDPRYLKARALDRFAPDATPTPGDPASVLGNRSAVVRGADSTVEASGTTHLSIVDRDGNAVSMTATIEAPFGSARWASGFLLNNEMTDFARAVPASGELPANAIAPGKRPRSSMSPTMVFDENGGLLMVTGSPGGNSIPAYVSKTIIGVLDWGLSAQEAANHPNIIARGERVRVETGVGNGADLAKQLAARGYDVQEREGENSGIHLIVISDGVMNGAADPRREGTVRTIR